MAEVLNFSNASNGTVDPRMAAHLDKTLKVANQMKGDYEVIKGAYETLKQQYGELMDAYKQTKDQCDIAFQSKSAVEKECEQLYKQWNDHIKQQADQFAEIQAQMVPSRELEMLRIQMAEELELPHRQRIEALSQEIDKYRDLYFKEHRSLELQTTNMELSEAEYKKSLADAKAVHEAGVAGLTAKNRTLQQLVEDKASADKTRALERENAELHMKQKQLLDEMASVRHGKDEALVALEELRLSASAALGQEKARSLVMETELQAYTSRCQEMTRHLHSLKATQAATLDQVLNLTDERRQLMAKAEALDRESRKQKAVFAAAATDSAQTLSDLRTRLHASLDETQGQLRASRKELEALEAKAQHDAQDASRRLQQTGELSAQRVQQVEKEKDALLGSLDNFHKTMSEQQSRHEYELDELRQQLERCDLECQSVSQERDALRSRVDRTQHSANQARADQEQQNKDFQDLDTEYAILQEKHRELLQREHESSAERSRVGGEVEMLRAENESMAEEAQEERRRVMESLQQRREEWQQERSALQDQLRALATTLDQERTTSKTDLDKTKLEKKRYKKMSQHLRTRAEALTRELGSSKQHWASSREGHTQELELTKTRMAEMERQRDDLRLRLTTSLKSISLSTSNPVLYTPSTRGNGELA